MMPVTRILQALPIVVLAILAAPVEAQIMSHAGDGVLNAPYRGTVDSLRECTMDVAFGEVKTHIEPYDSHQSITSSQIEIWTDGDWDRSVLRMYHGMDASGAEIDLTGTSSSSPVTAPVIDYSNARYGRFSFKAIGTKTLEVQSFDVTFDYVLAGSPRTVTRTIKVAPITGSFCALLGESEAFHFGTPILDIAVGNARLTVPVGQTAEMIGAAFTDHDQNLGETGIDVNDVCFPGAAETVHVQYMSQFRLRADSYEGKTDWGTPWPGYLIGYWFSGPDIHGPDGTFFDETSGTVDGFNGFDYIRPSGVAINHDATRFIDYDVNDRVTTIEDGAGTPNIITLTRNGSGIVTAISTSDGRGWTIASDPVDGWITEIHPNSGKGDRYFTYTAPAAGAPDAPRRVKQVKDQQQDIMYEFVYQYDGDGVPIELLEEKRYADDALRTVVEHEIVNDSLRRRKEHDGTGTRLCEFTYDSAATPNPLKHRLSAITAYKETGEPYSTAYTTTYEHRIDDPDGTMVIERVDLPDGTWLIHDYDSNVDAQTVHFGFRTRTTHHGPTDGVLVTYDVDYEFFYEAYGWARLFYFPRIVKVRDGRGFLSEVLYDFEDDDYPNGGEVTNRLLSSTGPTIMLGHSGTRTPQTTYTYDPNNKVLIRQETRYDSGPTDFRKVSFRYDDLLRLTKEIVDTNGLDLVTEYLYCDAADTQDRITIDPDGYWTRTRYDNDGRVATVERFLNPDAGTVGQPCTDPSGPFYGTTYDYDTNGRLDQRVVDNKDQDGDPLTPATIITEHIYDRLGRLTLRKTDPGDIGKEEHFKYNWLGEVVREYDTSGRGVKRVFDGRGLVEKETPLVHVDGDDDGEPDADLATSFTYDAMGRLETITRPTGAIGRKVYDDFGRLVQDVRVPSGGLVTNNAAVYAYDEASNVTRTTVRDDVTIGQPDTGSVISDTTAQYDEGGFNFEVRQRLDAGADGLDDPLLERKFDWAGNVIEDRSTGDATVGDRVVTTQYDDGNRVEYVVDSEGGQTQFVRDDRGNVVDRIVKLNAAEDATTTAVYDALSRATRTTDPPDQHFNRHYRDRKYDSRGNLLRETVVDTSPTPPGGKPEQMTTIYAYDNAGRRSHSVVLADAATTGLDPGDAAVTVNRVVGYDYDDDGRLRFTYRYNNEVSQTLVTETTYDTVGRVDVVTDPSGSSVAGDYAVNGLLDQRIEDDGIGPRTFQFVYDGHDRVSTHGALGTHGLYTKFEYDALDRQTVVTDPKGIKTRNEYDVVGRLTELYEDYEGALERHTVFTYNRLGQLTERTITNKDSGGGSPTPQKTTYRYDSMGRQTRAVYPDAPTGDHNDPETCGDCVRADYDFAGRMTTRTDQRDSAVSYKYDRRSLLVERQNTTGAGLPTDRFDHDALGRMTLAQRGTEAEADSVSSSVMVYDDFGNLTSATQAIGGAAALAVGYGYDQAGNRTRMTYPGGEELVYTPTAINQVDDVTLDGNPLVDYQYAGWMLDKRQTTTEEPGGTTVYEVDLGYDDHRRINGITNCLETPARGTEIIADYVFTHDDNGNPLTQTADGMPDFAGDDRGFSVDRLDRLTGTDYNETGTTEESTLDLLGNRELHTNRAEETIVYGPVNPANEYADVGGTPVAYDEAGNLTVDEDGRQYAYDEHNRLIQVKAADETVLANYAYDALGRRIVFEDPVAGVTTRYYYDGHSVIEERDATDALVRYHVNGAQYIDERIATYTESVAAGTVAADLRVGRGTQPRSSAGEAPATTPRQGTGAFTYYLMNQNFSIAGTGNADGSVIERLDYSSGGDFGDGGPPAGPYYFDADEDGDVDLSDFADFYACMLGPGPDPGSDCDLHDWWGDFTVDLADQAAFQFCFSGDGGTPPQQCLLSEGPCAAFFFDADFDGDIDLTDYADFYSCLAGPEVDRTPGCSMHDRDADYDVDLADQAALAACFSGDGLAPPRECCQPTPYYHDADLDGDVDLSDFGSLAECFYPGVEGSPFCVMTHDFDDSRTADGQIDLSDHAGFWSCFAGPRKAPPPACRREVNPTKRTREDNEPPPSGTFALHGRPIDVLSEGHVLIYVRARYYDPKHGRWLQRDSTGYTNGGSLYEAFDGNAVANQDPAGTAVRMALQTAGPLWHLEQFLRQYDFNLRYGDLSGWFAAMATTPRRRFVPVLGGVVDFEASAFYLEPGISQAELDQANEWASRGIAMGLGQRPFASMAGYIGFATAGSILLSPIPLVPLDYGFDRSIMDLEANYVAIPETYSPGTITGWLYSHPGGHFLIRMIPDVVPVGIAASPSAYRFAARQLDVLRPGAAAAYGRVEAGYWRSLEYLFDAKPGDVVFGMSLSPGPIRRGASGRQLLFDFADEVTPGLGPYIDVGGHHVHAKLAFEGVAGYDARDAFSVSEDLLRQYGVHHPDITTAQQRLFREFAGSGAPNTLTQHSRIAYRALVEVGIPPNVARQWVMESQTRLIRRRVVEPARIPWGGR